MTQEEYEKAIKHYRTTGWRTLWRPFIAWTYGLVCVFDFVITPLSFFILQTITGVPPEAMLNYTPLTLQGGGLYHLSMLAIVGVTSFGRTKEKLAGVADVLNDIKVEEPTLLREKKND